MARLNLRFHRHHLSNGLTVLTMEDHTHPIVSYQTHFATGSRNEHVGITGISHLFEHMMFRGSKKFEPEEFAQIIQANGGTLNAFTTTDNTTYFENLPADKLELAIMMEAERLEHLRLTAENLSSEREVVRSERKLRTVNSPFGLVVEQLFAIAFDQHPYQWPVIGWDDDLRRLTLPDCIDYYHRGYSPDKAVAVIVGHFNTEAALSLVRTYYDHLKPGAEHRAVSNQEPRQRGERRSIYKKVSQLEAFFAGFHVPGIGHPDIWPLIVLSRMASHGRSSPFYRRFVKPGRAVEAKVDPDLPPFWTMDPGLLQVYAVASPGVPIYDLEQEVWTVLGELGAGSFTDEELEKAKKGLEASYIMGLQSCFSRGLTVGLFEIKTGDGFRANQILEGYRSTTREDIRRVATTYVTEDNRTVVTLKPITPSQNEQLGPLE